MENKKSADLTLFAAIAQCRNNMHGSWNYQQGYNVVVSTFMDVKGRFGRPREVWAWVQTLPDTAMPSL